MTIHFLLATDLLKGSHKLSIEAMKITEKLKAKLSIVHIIETPLPSQYAHALGFSDLIEPSIQSAKEVLSTLADELKIPKSRQYTKAGKASLLITELAKELNVDAIIIGASAHTGIQTLLGSTANSILHKAQCNVLTLKNTHIGKG